MLSQFREDRETVLKLLEENKLVDILWKENSPISKDENCLFQMGKFLAVSIEELLEGDIPDPMVNFYICPQCKNMKRIMEFSSIKKTLPHEPFMIECGNKAGQQLYYDMIHVPFLSIISKDVSNYFNFSSLKDLSYSRILASDKLKDLSGSRILASDKLKDLSDSRILASDKFTNNMLINWYLQENILNLPHILENYISFVCNDYGYNLYEYSDIGNITQFQQYPQFLKLSDKPKDMTKFLFLFRLLKKY
jgi:hypothetical protein